MRFLKPLIATVGAAVSACSLLVEFRDMGDPCEGGRCVDATVADAAIDARDAGAVDSGPDVMFDAAHICKGSFDGWYCGFNSGLAGKAPSPDDLVHCIDGAVSLESCDAGCIAYPSGIPDMCNACAKRQGFYCHGQLGAQGQGIPYLSLCNGGQQIPQMKCTNGCNPGPGDAACQ